jgi:WD40 repeat protein
MRTLFRISTLLSVFILLASCSSPGPTVTNAPRDSATPLVHPSLTVTRSLEASATVTVSPASTATPAQTPVSLPIKTVNQACLTVEPELSQGFLSNGTILFYDWLRQTDNPFGILAITNQHLQPYPLPDAPQFYGPEAVSPDGKWLAYRSVLYENGQFNHNDDKLTIIDANGQVQAAMDWDGDWFNIIGWLDSERLYITTYDGSERGVNIVNPFTGESQPFSPSLPDLFIDPVQPPLKLLNDWMVVVDPSLARVAYMRGEPAIHKWEFSFIIRDILTNQEVLVLNKDARFDWPVWSSDNSQLAFIVQDFAEDNFERFELFITNWDGEVEEWVDLRGNADIGYQGIMSWSPDGRYLAISGKPLLILDMETRQVWDTCLSGGYYDWSGGPRKTMYWSPDSKQLLVTSYHEPGIVIDVENRVAAQIDTDPQLFPIGWLKMP